MDIYQMWTNYNKLWSVREIILYHDRQLLKEELLNCILLLPVGVLLPIIAGHEIKWYKALVIGVFISAIINCRCLVQLNFYKQMNTYLQITRKVIT